MISDDDRMEALKQNFSELKMPASQRRELINAQKALFKNTPNNPAVGHALKVLEPMLREAGVSKKDDPEVYEQFLGTLYLTMERKLEETKALPKDEEIRTIGAGMLRDQAIGTTWYGGNKTEKQFKVTPDEKMKQMIIDRYTELKGFAPSEGMIQQIFAAESYNWLYGKKKAEATPAKGVVRNPECGEMMDENFTEDRLSNLENTIRQLDTGARVQAVTGLDANPDEGARALELSRATGLAPSAVYNDIDGTERAHRSSLLTQMFDANPHLGEYVRANPLADVVSNDDYGNMDKFSRTVPGQEFLDTVVKSAVKSYLNWETPATAAFKGAVGGAVEGAVEGFGKTPIPKEDVEAWDKANPVLKYMYGGKDLGRALMSGFMGALTGGMTGGIEGIGKNVGAEDTEIGQLQRDALTAFEESMGRVGDHAGPVGEAIGGKRLVDQFNQQQAFRDAAQAHTSGLNTGLRWLEDGMEPPKGVSPELDSARADINKRWVEALDENLAAAQEMVTRERSPEHAEAFIRQHYGTSRLGSVW